MGEPGLKLAVAYLMISRQALGTATAAANEGQRDPVSGFPVYDIRANGFDDTGKLMARYVWKANIRIMPHPAMPIAPAQACCSDGNHHAAGRGFGIRQLPNVQ